MNIKIARAAQYIRMSTDGQELSPHIQRAAIQKYASEKGFVVVASYEDAGKSGLTLKGRPAMRRLLAAVTAIDRPFETILVYDVSRWGRFQDTDASAYHEYHCRLHGVDVRYVQEPFTDDCSPLNALLKSMKRAMAAEYSRELKVKSRSGQEEAMQRGFQMGKIPTIGYRRMSVPSNGSVGRLLTLHERKPMTTDRVRWVHGPAEEVELVRRLFKLYSETTITIKGLVSMLQGEGQTNSEGRPFTHQMLRTLLRCEAFTGTFTWGRREDRTGLIRQRGDPGYTRVQSAVEPIVSQSVWDRAQRKRRLDLNRRRTKEQAIEELRSAITVGVPFSIVDLPGSGCATESVYRRLFGSFSEALRLAGRDAEEVKATYAIKVARMRNLGARFRRDLAQLLQDHEVPFMKLPRSSTFVFGGHIRVAIQLIWRRNGRHGRTWWLDKAFSQTSDYVLIVRMESDGSALDFFLLETRHYVTHAPWFHDPDPEATRLFGSIDLVRALTGLKPASHFQYVRGVHRRLRYVTPIPIDVPQ